MKKYALANVISKIITNNAKPIPNPPERERISQTTSAQTLVEATVGASLSQRCIANASKLLAAEALSRGAERFSRTSNQEMKKISLQSDPRRQIDRGPQSRL